MSAIGPLARCVPPPPFALVSRRGASAILREPRAATTAMVIPKTTTGTRTSHSRTPASPVATARPPVSRAIAVQPVVAIQSEYSLWSCLPEAEVVADPLGIGDRLRPLQSAGQRLPHRQDRRDHDFRQQRQSQRIAAVITPLYAAPAPLADPEAPC